MNSNSDNALFTIGLIAVSDRASSGEYVDKGIPALRRWLERTLSTKWQVEERVIADDIPIIEKTLIELCDQAGCNLVLTTGGTGPALRDVTPEATLAVIQRTLPGFSEQMRTVGLKYVPTAILARQVVGIRNQSLVINLPGNPKAIEENLDAIFAAVPYCLDLIGAPSLNTNPDVIVAFRPNKKTTQQ